MASAIILLQTHFAAHGPSGTGAISNAFSSIRPVVVADAFVDPSTGSVVGRIERGSEYGWSEPIPGQPGRFHHHGTARHLPTGWVPAIDLLVDASTRTTTTEGVLVEDHNQVSRLGPDGTTTWQFEVGSVRPPASAEINGLVMIAARHGLIGVDSRTGVPIWKSEANGPSNRLTVAGDVVIATGGSLGSEGDPIVAYRADGTEAWRGVLPTDSDVDRIIDASGAIVVLERGFGRDAAWSRIFAKDGRLRCALDSEGIVDAVAIAGSDDLLVAGTRGIARITPGCEDVWRTTEPSIDSRSTVGITWIKGNDCLISIFSSYSDSGVRLMRLDTVTGRPVWKQHASRIGGWHSKYRQTVYLEPRGEELVVVSQASGGHFVERRQMADGSLLHRAIFGDPSY